MNSDLFTKILRLVSELLSIKQSTLVLQSNLWAMLNRSIVFGSCKVITSKSH